MSGDTPVRPYRKIQLSALPREEQSMFAKAEFVFRTVCSEAIQVGAMDSLERLETMDLVQWDAVFRAGFTSMVSRTESQINRRLKKAGELSIVTMYDYFCKLQ